MSYLLKNGGASYISMSEMKEQKNDFDRIWRPLNGISGAIHVSSKEMSRRRNGSAKRRSAVVCKGHVCMKCRRRYCRQTKCGSVREQLTIGTCDVCDQVLRLCPDCIDKTPEDARSVSILHDCPGSELHKWLDWRPTNHGALALRTHGFWPEAIEFRPDLYSFETIVRVYRMLGGQNILTHFKMKVAFFRITAHVAFATYLSANWQSQLPANNMDVETQFFVIKTWTLYRDYIRSLLQSISQGLLHDRIAMLILLYRDSSIPRLSSLA